MAVVDRKKWKRLLGDRFLLKEGDVFCRFGITPEEVIDGDEDGFVLNRGWNGMRLSRLLEDYDRADMPKVYRSIEKPKPRIAARLALNRRYAKPLPLP